MEHKDHVNLLRPANLTQGGTWADFGAGSGAFTLALSELVGLKAEIYAIDKDRSGFDKLEQSHRALFGTSQNIHPMPRRFHRCAFLTSARWHRDGKLATLLQGQGKGTATRAILPEIERSASTRRIQCGLWKYVGSTSIIF